jgi:hypothetical protein
MEEQVINLGSRLAEVLGKSSYSWVSTKITQAKEKKLEGEKELIYDEIISNLLQDKMELEMLTREYKELYEKITISDDDIEHLQKTIKHVVELFSTSPTLNSDQVEMLISLVNKDTLKTMQLLGFNYKEAIGQPLTEVCASAIHRKLGGGKNGSGKQQKNRS